MEQTSNNRSAGERTGLIDSCLETILAGGNITKRDAVRLSEMPETEAGELFRGAERLRRHYFGNTVQTCAICNARSGHCSEDCAYCAQSARYQATPHIYELLDNAELAAARENAAANGIDRFSYVTSGRGLEGRDFARLLDALKPLASNPETQGSAGNRPKLCASLGILEAEQFHELRKAGIRRYHHNLETAASFFPEVCTTHSYGERRNTVLKAAEAGMEVCSGVLLGLGESWEQRIEAALDLRELPVISVPVNFLSPIPDTPLGKRPLMRPLEALKSLALYRFILPDREIRVCGGRSTTLRDLQSWIFKAGASGMMVGNYLTTGNRELADDVQMIEDLGLQRESKAKDY